ncbi:two-component sensor histidine kinase [Nocardiopsis sp. TSRI0078]|uniref:sensor histidine kinase n=1 Tax=unclassified Nocardiopsis TaxID=2649073 RepID=UPI00093DB930|nr:two-component sensor histidine kinase [Nocardiopsis sp. TSRI0078]
MTSLALALFYLAPAFMLIVSATWIGFAATAPWQPDVPRRDPDRPAVDAVAFLVALPVAATLLARLACRVQRNRLDNVFGIVETSPPDPLAAHTPLLRAWRFLFGRDAWSAVVYSTVAGAHGLLAAGAVVLLVVCGGATAAGALVGIVFVLAQGAPGDLVGPLVLVVVGPLCALVGLRLAPFVVATEVLLHRMLLFEAPEVRIRRRLVHVQDSRLRMVDAAESERRRIERDLHDGAQQRLLALSMTLTRARSRVGTDPETVLELITEAQRESREVMDELRQVARGLHPRVLTDHGLGAALPVAAGRAPVPVRVDVELGERPSPRAEGVAYYVACEALTNIAKHAGAARVTVAAERIPRPARRGGDLLRLTVTDDGAGGADPEAGTGLYGLWDRVDAVDGTLTVHSPSGEGTVLTADIPWEA